MWGQRIVDDGAASTGGPFPRRGLLAGALGLGLLTAGACGVRPAESSASPPASPVPPPATVESLLAASPFYVAHRGGGGDWPEMTAYAYDQATKLPGLQAIEISVCLSLDGVLVCSHDATTLRTTGVDYTIREQPWSVLAPLQVTAAATDDPTQPARPLSRLDDVLAAHLDRFVAFVEPKTPEAIEPLFAALKAADQAERVVWKQPVNQPHFGRAKSLGFGTWGYVLDEPGHIDPSRLARFAASEDIDLLGAPRTESDDFVTTVVRAATGSGKKTMMWDIRDDADRQRALSLGCTGLMTSGIRELLETAR